MEPPVSQRCPVTSELMVFGMVEEAPRATTSSGAAAPRIEETMAGSDEWTFGRPRLKTSRRMSQVAADPSSSLRSGAEASVLLLSGKPYGGRRFQARR
jgi:hypothetical protein